MGREGAESICIRSANTRAHLFSSPFMTDRAAAASFICLQQQTRLLFQLDQPTSQRTAHKQRRAILSRPQRTPLARAKIIDGTIRRPVVQFVCVQCAAYNSLSLLSFDDLAYFLSYKQSALAPLGDIIDAADVV